MSLKTAASAENAVVNNIMTPIEKKVLITKWEVMLAVLVLVSPNPPAVRFNRRRKLETSRSVFFFLNEKRLAIQEVIYVHPHLPRLPFHFMLDKE